MVRHATLHAFYNQPERTMFRHIVIIVVLLSMFFVVVSEAEGRCRTDACWERVHKKRVINSVEKKIARITPYRCWTVTGIFRSAKPCWVITQESAMVRAGPWRALNTWVSGTPCGPRACGPYQFVGKDVPWPVIVKSRYETLKRKLAHHRQAVRLSLSHWVN